MVGTTSDGRWILSVASSGAGLLCRRLPGLVPERFLPNETVENSAGKICPQISHISREEDPESVSICAATDAKRRPGFPICGSLQHEFLKHFRRDLEGAQARRVIVDLRGRDDFVGLGFVEQRLQVDDARSRPNRPRNSASVGRRPRVRPRSNDPPCFRPAAEVCQDDRESDSEIAVARKCEAARLAASVSAAKTPAPTITCGCGQRGGRFEIPAVKRERDLQIIGRKMGSESERQSELRRKLGAEIARA